MDSYRSALCLTLKRDVSFSLSHSPTDFHVCWDTPRLQSGMSVVSEEDGKLCLCGNAHEWLWIQTELTLLPPLGVVRPFFVCKVLLNGVAISFTGGQLSFQNPTTYRLSAFVPLTEGINELSFALHFIGGDVGSATLSKQSSLLLIRGSPSSLSLSS